MVLTIDLAWLPTSIFFNSIQILSPDMPVTSYSYIEFFNKSFTSPSVNRRQQTMYRFMMMFVYLNV